MKDEPLIDEIMRASYEPSFPWRYQTRSPIDIRMALHRSRRFVLDDTVSQLLADLATVPFYSVANERRPEILTSLRHGARAPFPTTWIEYDEIAFRERLIAIQPDAHDVRGKLLLRDRRDLPRRLGWLIEQHPKVETAVMMTEGVSEPVEGEHMPALLMPYSYVWQTTDDPLPWHADTRAAMLGHGVTHLADDFAGVVYRCKPEELKLKVQVEGADEFMTHPLLSEFAGALRYCWAFLATLNDVPVEFRDVRPSKGYMAGRSYRKYLDHRVVSLRIPQRMTIAKLARKLIAAARRRAHSVRGHWRIYERTVVPSSCWHDWKAADEHGHAECKHCSSWRTWIAAHERGDATLGYVTHEFKVTAA